MPRCGKKQSSSSIIGIMAIMAQRGGCPIGPRYIFFGCDHGTIPIQLNMISQNSGSLVLFFGGVGGGDYKIFPTSY